MKEQTKIRPDFTEFERLAVVAQRDKPGPVDVTGRVMGRLHQLEEPSPLKSPFVLMSGATTLAACLAAATYLPTLMAWTDPMTQFLLGLGI